MKQTLLIRIEEHKLQDSPKIVTEIAKASHETKQRWYGLPDSEPESFDQRALMFELISRQNTKYRLKNLFNKLSPYFQKKAGNHYNDFENYNTKIFNALNSANDLNFLTN